ncbi:MAG TPA: hypothetical protein PKA27_00475 [Fimbriimonadaceae bacterium]|nr:hypothetical protein [Fimbriimonadaceae bacterium]
MPFDPAHHVNLVKGKFAKTSASDMDGMFAAFSASGRQTLVIHFHGGLVSEESALKTASLLQKPYEDAGAYPIFIVWETGILEVAQNSWARIAGETVFKILVDRVAGFAAGKLKQALGLKGLVTKEGKVDDNELAYSAETGDFSKAIIGQDELDAFRATPSDLSESDESFITSQLEADFDLVGAIQGAVNSIEPPSQVTKSGHVVAIQASHETLMAPAALQQFSSAPGGKGIVNPLSVAKAVMTIIAKVVKRFVQGRDHGLHATVVEEILRSLYIGNIGEAVWGAMKSYPRDAFGADPSEFGGTRLLDRLAGLPAGTRVVLVGHSAGSIYISEIVEQIRKQNVSIRFDVVYLAPAVRTDRAVEVLGQGNWPVDGFRMYTMGDDWESKDVLVSQVPFFYPRSLLYFISGILEGGDDVPLLGMQRYLAINKWFSDDPNVAAMRNWLYSAPNRICFCPSSGSVGLEANARSHGDFDELDWKLKDGKLEANSTIASLQHVIKNGF